MKTPSTAYWEMQIFTYCIIIKHVVQTQPGRDHFVFADLYFETKKAKMMLTEMAIFFSSVFSNVVLELG